MSICLGFAARQPHTDTRLQAHRDNRSKQALIMRKRFSKRRAQWDSRCPLGCAETLRAAEPPFAPPFAANCTAVACATMSWKGGRDRRCAAVRRARRRSAISSPEATGTTRSTAACPHALQRKRLKGFSARSLKIFLDGSFLAFWGQRLYWMPIRLVKTPV